MLYYDRIDVSEGIDINKTSESKECDICHYCYFLNMTLSDIAILKIKDYRCFVTGVKDHFVIVVPLCNTRPNLQ